MTLLREHLLYGLLVLGLYGAYMFIGILLRLRRYKGVALPMSGSQTISAFIIYAIFFAAGVAGTTGCIYLLCHPEIRSLTVPATIIHVAGGAFIVLMLCFLIRLPGAKERMARAAAASPVVRDALKEADEIASGHPSPAVRRGINRVTLVFLAVILAVFAYENTVNSGWKQSEAPPESTSPASSSTLPEG